MRWWRWLELVLLMGVSGLVLGEESGEAEWDGDEMLWAERILRTGLGCFFIVMTSVYAFHIDQVFYDFYPYPPDDIFS